VALQIGINVGFVTNSSSMVYHFPRELLNDPKIKGFLKAFEIEEGFVGSDLWDRGQCGTLAITREQKEEAHQQLANAEYGHAGLGLVHLANDDEVTVIYGDEYNDLAACLGNMLEALCRDRGIPLSGRDYN
jgi:hypothetical protein